MRYPAELLPIGFVASRLMFGSCTDWGSICAHRGSQEARVHLYRSATPGKLLE